MNNDINIIAPLQQNEVLPIEIDQQQESVLIKQKKKCHGNRKLHHFKRKWLARGKTKEEIEELITLRNNNNNNNNDNNQISSKNHKNKKQSNKRKRSQQNNQQQNTTIRSISQLSISQQQPLPKKIKPNNRQNNMTTQAAAATTTTNNQSITSKYLHMPKKLLLHSLRHQLNHRIKKRKEKSFILSRIRLLDQQFCISMDQYLYQSYYADGFHYKIWPDDIIKMIQTTTMTTITDNYEHIENYVKDHLNQLQYKFDQSTTQLINQALSCPKSMELSLIESQLKKFVRLHHLDLSRKINFQINTFQDHIREKELFQLLLLYPLTNEQQQTLQRLSFLRQQQFATFEEMTKLEVRILCRILPKSINELDRLIPANHLSSTNTNLPNNNSVYELIKNQQKMIREYKRQLLAKNFEEYESTIEEIEFQFQKELFQLESELSYNIDDNEQINTNTNHLVNVINNYLHCQTTRQMRALRYNETIFRYKLLHPSHPRSSKSNYKNTISIYPEAIIELFEQIFTKKELDLLSTLGPSYIRLNQSSVQKQKVVQKKVKHQHTTMIHKLATDLNRRHGLPTKSAIIKQFGSQSEVIFNQQFSTSSSLTYHNMYRTRHELNTILSIKRKLKRLPIIIRQSDKTGIMHIGYKSDYDKKVLLYQEKTIAYKELIYNPLIDTFFKVIRVLNDLLRDKEIKVWQYKKMVPDQNKIQLAYLYFIPKPHKEGTPLRPIVSSINAPTTGISKLLDRLIRPLFDQHVEQTTIIDGVHLIRRLQLYVKLGLLKTTTHICTCDITDLYTMLPQEESINILKRFLEHFGYTHVQGMTINAIESLARIVLMENVFYYEQKYYCQIKGGAMGSAFTLTLANIFMWHWEQTLVEHQRNSTELYGRYIDDIFFTSNDSMNHINQLLKEANDRHTNIKLTSVIQNPNSFLDVNINNVGHDLITSVYHKQSS
ncbi:unnamed protein product, partial [Adineta steineri]